MEEWQPSPDDESKDEKTPSKKRKTDFLSIWKRRRDALHAREEQGGDEEEDDDDEDMALYKKIGKFLRKFRRPDDEEKPHESKPDTVVFEQLSYSDQPVELPLENQEDQYRPIESAHERQESTLRNVDDQIPHTETVQPPELQDQEYSLPRESLPEPEVPSPAQSERPTVPIEAVTLPEQVVYERIEPIQETERIVERRDPNLLPIIALEYIGRKRADRKIRKQVSELQKQVVRGQQAQNRLEELRTVAEAPRMTSFERNLQAIEKKLETVKPFRYEQPSTPLRPEAFKPLAARESIAPERQPSQRTVEWASVPDTDKLVEQHVRPETVLEQVVNAAEHDIAAEKVYERCQEVRDEPGTGTMAGGAQPIGAVMAASQAHAHLIESQKRAATQINAPRTGSSHTQQPEQYKQAVGFGLAAAAVILIFGLIAYALVR